MRGLASPPLLLQTFPPTEGLQGGPRRREPCGGGTPTRRQSRRLDGRGSDGGCHDRKRWDGCGVLLTLPPVDDIDVNLRNEES